jgi:hypothetical protein
VLLLLDGRNHPKECEQLEYELVTFLGWENDQIYGPEQWVFWVLKELDREEVIQSRGLRCEDYAMEFWRWEGEKAG